MHAHYRQVRFLRLPNALLEEGDVHSPNQINGHLGISTYALTHARTHTHTHDGTPAAICRVCLIQEEERSKPTAGSPGRETL